MKALTSAGSSLPSGSSVARPRAPGRSSGQAARSCRGRFAGDEDQLHPAFQFHGLQPHRADVQQVGQSRIRDQRQILIEGQRLIVANRAVIDRD